MDSIPNVLVAVFLVHYYVILAVLGCICLRDYLDERRR